MKKQQIDATKRAGQEKQVIPRYRPIGAVRNVIRKYVQPAIRTTYVSSKKRRDLSRRIRGGYT